MSKAIKVVRFIDGGEVYIDAAHWNRAKAEGRVEVLNGKQAEKALKDYRRAKLLKIIKPKSTLTAVCTYSNRSGLTVHRYRVFMALATKTGPYIRELTTEIAELCGFRLKDGEIVMGGCGYSKPFQIGYELGRCLWPDGTPEPHGTRNGVPDSDGGYAIRCRCD